jgi:molybdopterin-synthase adenylyltransferase
MALSDDQMRRYSRHVLLAEVGGVGQKRWLASAVAIETLDRAGQAAVVYLAAAGVGTIVIRDRGVVEEPGPLFEIDDVGLTRMVVAVARVKAINPDVRVVDALPTNSLTVRPRGDVTGDPVGAGAAAARAALRELLQ